MNDTQGSSRRGDSPDIRHAPEARKYGFPAVLGHEVVALSCVAREDWDSSEPGHVCVIHWRDGGIASERMPDERLYVWARAGRVTFAAADGSAVNLTMLGEHEHDGLMLGAPWPKRHSRSRASNIVHGAVTDVKNAVTFPASFPRIIRTSGARNSMLDTLIGWCRREIPDLHILHGGLRGAERPDANQLPALPLKGLLGEPGWQDPPPAGAERAERAEH